MSLPIKSTPVLCGKDARRFVRRAIRNSKKKAPIKKILKAIESVRSLLGTKKRILFKGFNETYFGN
jgi:hypothetical protein